MMLGTSIWGRGDSVWGGGKTQVCVGNWGEGHMASVGGVGSAESWRMLGPGCAGHRLKELGSNYT